MKYFTAALKKYAVFSGRSRRKEYFFFGLFYFLFVVAAFLLVLLIPLIGIFLFMGVLLGGLIPAFACAVRRMHDVNKTGWYIFIPIYSLILVLSEGTSGVNKYGPDPRRPEFEDFLSEPADVAVQTR